MSKQNEMNMSKLVEMAMTEAMKITGADAKDEQTQKVAFQLACMAMAQEKAA